MITALQVGHLYKDRDGDLHVALCPSDQAAWRTFYFGEYEQPVSYTFEPDHPLDQGWKKTNRPPWRVFSKQRSDGFIFYCAVSPDGKKTAIVAGCRSFSSISDAEKFWTDEVWFDQAGCRSTKTGATRSAASNRAINAESRVFIASFKRSVARYRASLKTRKAA